MNIQSVRPEIVAEAAKAKPKSKNANNELPSEGVVRDSYMPEQNENLMQALRSQPDVRPDVLERARRLVADPDYPPKEVIGAVAKFLVQSNEK